MSLFEFNKNKPNLEESMKMLREAHSMLKASHEMILSTMESKVEEAKKYSEGATTLFSQNRVRRERK
jgi:hypothetical protein